MARKRLISVTAVLTATLVLALAVPVSAAEGPKHGTCAAFGHSFAGWAHSEKGIVGEGMSWLARNLGPGGVADLLDHEKLVGIGEGSLCETGD